MAKIFHLSASKYESGIISMWQWREIMAAVANGAKYPGYEETVKAADSGEIERRISKMKWQ